MTRLYYIVQSELLTGGVIEAQVIGTLRAQSRIPGQPRTRLIFLEPARVAFGARARAKLRQYREYWPEGRIAILPYVSRLGSRGPGRTLATFLAHERMRSTEPIFHARGPIATYTAHVARRLLGKGRLIFDVRGPSADETIQRLGYPFRTNLPDAVERSYQASMASDVRAAEVADHIFTVSAGLKRYAIEHFGALDTNVSVVPSCVDDLVFSDARRAAARRDWGIASDAVVLAYAGRLGPERLPEHMVRLFAAVRRVTANAKLVLMTYLNQVEDLDAVLQAHGIDRADVLAREYPRDTALEHMCGADVGMLFCEPAARYRDWFPIKFPEYLSAGLGVALNSLVGDLPALVDERRIGWVIDPDVSDADLAAKASEIVREVTDPHAPLRERSLAACADLYVWRTYVPAIRRAYGVESEPVDSRAADSAPTHAPS